MSFAEFTKKIIESATAGTEGWPLDAVFKMESFIDTNGDVVVGTQYFTTQEQVDEVINGYRRQWEKENFEARIEVYEWDLGPQHSATYTFRKSRSKTRNSRTGLTILGAAAVVMAILAVKGRK